MMSVAKVQGSRVKSKAEEKKNPTNHMKEEMSSAT